MSLITYEMMMINFDAQWGYNDHEAQEKSFFEWCSLYDDLKHIKKTKEVN
jgi:hypothetical protein